MTTIDRRGLTVGDTSPSAGSTDPSANLAIKTPVRVATTANITLSGAQTIDGVAVVANDRVLVKSQTDATENGIYLVSSGNWARTTDLDSAREAVKGTIVFVNEGTIGGNTAWKISASDPIAPDTTSLSFVEFGGSNISVLPTGATVARDIADWMADDPYIEDFGGGTGVADNTAAFNLAVATGSGVRFKYGTYNFTTAPSTITKSFRVTGYGGNNTVLSRNYVESTPSRGLLNWTGGHAVVSDLFIIAGDGSSGGAPIGITAAAPPATPSSCYFTNLRHSVTGTGAWDYSLYLDGSALTSPLGLRTCYLSNVTLFGASVRSALIKSVVHFDWIGGGVNSAGGTDGSLELTGTAAVTSQAVTINIDYIDQNLVLDRAIKSNIFVGEIAGNITNTANTAQIIGSGYIRGGAPQNNWTSSSWMSGNQFYIATGGIINWGSNDVAISMGAGILSFAGASTGGYQFDAAVAPSSNDGAALGSTSQSWSDIFLASGGVLNWNSGDVTVTHSSNALAFAGASSGYSFDNTVNIAKTGGNLLTARFNSSNVPIGFYTGGSSGATALAGNVTWSGSGNTFNIDRTGDWWFWGNVAGVGGYAVALSTGNGTSGTTADYVTNAWFALTSAGQVLVRTATDATTASNGALAVTGGISSAKAIVGGTSIKSLSATAGVGYATGAGGAVTQVTSRTTGVTLDKVCGAITLFAAAPVVGTWESFTVTNSTVSATDVPHVAVKSGTNTYIAHVTAVANGSFRISFTSISGTASDSPVINFDLGKAVAS